MYRIYDAPALLIDVGANDVSHLRCSVLLVDHRLPVYRIYDAPALLMAVVATDVTHLRRFWFGANGCSFILILWDLFPGCDYADHHYGAAPIGALTSVAFYHQ